MSSVDVSAAGTQRRHRAGSGRPIATQSPWTPGTGGRPRLGVGLRARRTRSPADASTPAKPSRVAVAHLVITCVADVLNSHTTPSALCWLRWVGDAHSARRRL